MKRILIAALLMAAVAGVAEISTPIHAQAISARKVSPNLEGSMDTPLRYRPDGTDFVIENGEEFFNRPMYGGNTGFRVDAGDKPEFSMYLPGRGGNLRLGIKAPAGSKWLHTTQRITARYRPGGMIYEIRDPLLGTDGILHIEAYALAATEGLIVKVEGRGTPAGVELVWAFGGTNGQRGARDGDIGTERVPISEYFQLTPDFCKGNTFDLTAGSFTMRATPGAMFGRISSDAKPEVADARQWASVDGLLGSVKAPGDLTVVVGHVALTPGQTRYLSLQRLSAAAAADLATYQEVTASRPAESAQTSKLLPAFKTDDLPKVFADVEQHFSALRGRLMIDTPDPYLNAAAGALTVGADAVWDDPQGAVMHGAIAWRTKLLGWRGPYAMDDLGWHDRARKDFEYWATRQNVSPIPAKLPGPDEAQNLARSEAALHSNGDMSNSHYDMNMVHIDEVFRHILWTGDIDFARKEWPVIERHLAWERRLFRRPYGTEQLPLYEAYAAIWASDDLQYGGGGTAHATAYNYYHNMMASRVAIMLGKDATIYDDEMRAIGKAMREFLWLGDRGWYAEFRDYLGLQLAHPSAALWTFYHTIDSEAATPLEAWQMSRQVDTQLPHIPVRGPGVPTDEKWEMMSTSDWMPYKWSINNVCMNENAHTALGYFQAGRAEEGHRLLTSSVLASMYMGISPGNVGTMNYLDVYRRESQRDFGDGSGTLSRALVEGLFGLRPDLLAGHLRFAPGFPAKWDHAGIKHPDVDFAWKKNGPIDSFAIVSRFPKPLGLELEWPARGDDVASVTINGKPVQWMAKEESVGMPRILVTAPAGLKWDVVITWKGNAPTPAPAPVTAASGENVTIAVPGVKVGRLEMEDPQHLLAAASLKEGAELRLNTKITGTPGARTFFVHAKQGAFSWWMPMDVQIKPIPASSAPAFNWAKADPAAKFETVDLSKLFNEKVTQIFKKEYRSPRSPFVSLALPKQGIGAWAGEVTATAVIDDTGLRRAATTQGGKIVLPNGVPFATPGGTGAASDTPNILFTSQWDNFPKEATVSLSGKAKRVLMLMAGSTNHMQSRLDNGEVIITYTDGTTARLALENPTTWWPIEQDYFIDDYQFRLPGAIPPRLNLRTAEFRLLDPITFKGKGGTVAGGAATALDLSLDPNKELKSLTMRTLANEVVIGLMSVTLER